MFWFERPIAKPSLFDQLADGLKTLRCEITSKEFRVKSATYKFGVGIKLLSLDLKIDTLVKQKALTQADGKILQAEIASLRRACSAKTVVKRV